MNSIKINNGVINKFINFTNQNFGSLVAFTLFMSLSYPLFNVVLSPFTLVYSLGRYFILAVMLVCQLWCVLFKVREKFWFYIKILIVFAVILAIQLLHFSNFSNAFYILLDCMVKCIPIFIISTFVTNWKEFFVKQRKYIVFLLLIIAGYYMVAGDAGRTIDGGQSIGFVLIIYVAFSFSCYIISRAKIDLFLTLAMTSVMFILGSRTIFFMAVLIIFFGTCFIFAQSFINEKDIKKRNRRIVILVISSCILLLCVFNMKAIALFINGILVQHNIYIRVVSVIAKGKLFNGSGREWIFSFMIEQIQTKPLLGGGVGIDRVILHRFIIDNQTAFDPSIMSAQIYAHNIILESAVSFGIPITIGAIGYYLYNVYVSLKKLSFTYKTILLVIILAAVAPLMLVSTVWSFRSFWVMLGFMVVILQNRLQE